jgi:hypothetical protein
VVLSADRRDLTDGPDAVLADLAGSLGRLGPADALALSGADSIRRRLGEAVRELVARGDDIRSLLYRVDVDEYRVGAALAGLDGDAFADALAGLVWERSLQKFRSRSRYRAGRATAG